MVPQSSAAPLANLDLIMTAKHPSSTLKELQSIIRSASPDQNQQFNKVINAYQNNEKGGLFEHHFQDLTLLDDILESQWVKSKGETSSRTDIVKFIDQLNTVKTNIICEFKGKIKGLNSPYPLDVQKIKTIGKQLNALPSAFKDELAGDINSFHSIRAQLFKDEDIMVRSLELRLQGAVQVV